MSRNPSTWYVTCSQEKLARVARRVLKAGKAKRLVMLVVIHQIMQHVTQSSTMPPTVAVTMTVIMV